MLSGYPHLEETIRFAELVFPLLPGKQPVTLRDQAMALPRPRDRRDPALARYEAEILTLLDDGETSFLDPVQLTANEIPLEFSRLAFAV